MTVVCGFCCRVSSPENSLQEDLREWKSIHGYFPATSKGEIPKESIKKEDWKKCVEAVSRAQTNVEKLNKVLEFVKNIDVAEWEKICPRTVIKWENDNCIFATELQKRICTSPRFVTFFSLLNDIEFPCDTYPLVGELVKFVCECIKKPGFDNNGAIPCMSILETLAKDKRMPWAKWLMMKK